MSEKKKRPKAYSVNYEISQSIVATRFRCGWTSDYDFITNLLFSLLWKNLLLVNIWQNYGKESWLPKRWSAAGERIL